MDTQLYCDHIELIEVLTLDEFLAGTERRAYRKALIATGNREDALEIVQDAMLKLVKSYSQKPSAEWGPLFERILQSTIRDWYRRSKVRNSLRFFFKHDDDEEAEDPLEKIQDDYFAQPDEQLREQRAMEALEKALHKLPLRQQQAYLLRHWEGMDVAETARAMGCSEGSVKTHLSRAVAALRNQLEDHWP